jgi:hypothetical protein
MRPLFALFVRSLRDDTRARLPILLRATLVVIILLIVWANQRDFTRRAAPGREFLLIVVMVNLAFVAIAALGSFSAAITEEKEDETLPLLRMTGISPLAILFGKSTTQLLGALLLLVVQIPFTVLAVTLGGISIGQVLSAYAVLGATTFFLCNLALLGSVVCRTTIRAGVFTGISGGLVFALLPFIGIVTVFKRVRPGALSPQTAWETISTWVLEANPMYALAMLLEQRLGSYSIQKHVCLNLGAGLLCFLLSWLAFDRFCSVAGERVGRRGRMKFTGFLRAMGELRRPSPSRALAWKDFHFLIGGWRGMFVRSAIYAATFLCCYAFERWDSPRVRYFWRQVAEETMTFSAIGFGIELSLLAARIFGMERRALTLSGLVGLPQETGWLIGQKLLGCLPALLPSAALFGIGVAIRFDYDGVRRWRDEAWIVAFYFFSQVLLLPLVTAWLSLRLRRGALPAGVAIIAALNVFTVVLVESGPSNGEEDVIAVTACFSLIAAFVMARWIYREIPRAAAED